MEKEKQGNWFQRHKILTGIIAFIFIIAIASSASDNDAKVVENSQTDSSSSQSDDAQTLEKTEFKVGEIISFDYKEVTVLGTTRNWSSGNQFITPSSGNEYVMVNVSIENKSTSEINFNTFDWKIKNSQGVIKDIDSSTYSVDGGLGSGELAEGGKVSGFLIFEVPSGDEGMTLQYSPSFWTSKKLEIKL